MYLPDLSNIGFQSNINKSSKEKKNFFLTPKNSLKLDDFNCKNNNEENIEKSFLMIKERRMSNILKHHLDQSEMNSLKIRERNNSKTTDNSNSNIEKGNEDLNYLNINSILSNTHFSKTNTLKI